MSKGLHKSILLFTISILLLCTLFLPQLVLADEDVREHTIERERQGNSQFELSDNKVTEYIVQKVKPSKSLRSLSTKTTSNKPSKKYEVLNTTKAELKQKQKNGEIYAFQPNRVLKATLVESIPLINATAVWPITHSGVNNTGVGQTICIIDTGINDAHADLAGRQLAEYDFKNDRASVIDVDGHGTHVAGIALADGTLKGVAPGANYVDAKILESGGNTADLIDAIEYCTDNSEIYNITIISMSLGSEELFATSCDADDPLLTTAVNAAVAKNISVIAASGNNASDVGISSPACIENVIAVGATTKDNLLTGYSNLNSLVDIVAPGSLINSTSAAGNYEQMSGTSMATPHVAGALALLNQFAKEKNNEQTPAELSTILKETGFQIYYGFLVKNFSRIDVYAAIQSLDTVITTHTQDRILMPGDLLINISVTPSYFANYTNVTLSLASLGSACDNRNYINLSYDGTNWNGNCTLNATFLPATPQEYNFTLSYVDDQDNSGDIANITYILHNIPALTYNKPCWELNTSSTNLSTITNYAQTNFSLEFNLNQSCYTGQTHSLPGWNDYTKVLTINYTDVNISSLTTLQSLAILNETFNISMTTRFSYENTSVELDSSLTQLEQNATINFTFLGFNTKPQGAGTEYVFFGPVITDNVSIAGVSRYDVNISTILFYDAVPPTMSLVSPLQNITTNETNITFVVNTTSTNLAQIQATFQNELYQYNTSIQNESFVCVLNQSEIDLHTCTIYNITTTDSANTTLQINVTDFGNNTLPQNVSYLIDTTAPNITLNVSNGTTFADDEFQVQFNITDLTNTTCWTNSNGTNTTETSCSTSQNVSFSGFADGNYTISFYANDSFGFVNEEKLNITILEVPTIIDRTVQTQRNNSVYFSMSASDNDELKSTSFIFNGEGVSAQSNSTTFSITISQNDLYTGIYNYTFIVEDVNNHTNTFTENITLILLAQNQTILENTTQEIVITNSSNRTEIIVPKNKAATNLTIRKNTTDADAPVYLNFTYLNTTQNVTLESTLNVTVLDELNITTIFANGTLLQFEQNQTTLFQTPNIELTSNFTLSQTTIREVISIGSNVTINASKPIQLILYGEGDKKAAYAQSLGALTKITTVCDSATNPTNIDATTTRECYITSGGNLIIWTYHLTYFASYTDVPQTPSGGGGGSSGGSSSMAPATQTPSNTTRLFATYVIAEIDTSFATLPSNFAITKLVLRTSESATNVAITMTKEEPASDEFEKYTLTHTNLNQTLTNISLLFTVDTSWLTSGASVIVLADGIVYNTTEKNNQYNITMPLVKTFSIKQIKPIVTNAVLEDNITLNQTTQLQNISQVTNGKKEKREWNIPWKNIVFVLIAIVVFVLGYKFIMYEKRKPRAQFKIPKF